MDLKDLNTLGIDLNNAVIDYNPDFDLFSCFETALDDYRKEMEDEWGEDPGEDGDLDGDAIGGAMDAAAPNVWGVNQTRNDVHPSSSAGAHSTATPSSRTSIGTDAHPLPDTFHSDASMAGFASAPGVVGTTPVSPSQRVKKPPGPVKKKPNRRPRQPEKKEARMAAAKAKKIQARRDKIATTGYHDLPQSSRVQAHQEQATVHDTPMNMGDVENDSSGWTAVNNDDGKRRRQKRKLKPFPDAPVSKDDLLKWGLEELPVVSKHPRILCDKNHRVYAVVVQQDDPTFEDSCLQLHDVLLAERNTGDWGKKEQDILRGTTSLNFGTFIGYFLPKMTQMRSSKPEVINRLCENDLMHRIGNVASATMARYFPEFYKEAHERMLAIQEEIRRGVRTVFGSVYSMMAINFGPRSCSSAHRDTTDLLTVCSVTVFGRFCSKKGAHLALFEAGRLVEMPPGSTILFPSALITHANALIQEDETRTSIVQYTPGALARFVRNGFKHPSELKRSNPQAWLAAMADKETRWEEFKNNFFTVDQLKEYWRKEQLKRDKALKGDKA